MPTEIIRRVPAVTSPPARPVGGDVPGTATTTYRRRGAAVYAAVAASVAAVIAVIALVVVLASRHDGETGKTDQNVPTLGGPAPTDVQLADHTGTITVTWTDPAEGRTTFIVEMARPGQVMKSVGQVGPGQTSFRMEGLNDKLDYCFTVVAVYSTTRFAASPQACTSRGTPR